MSHRVLVSASAMAVLVALVSSGAAPATAQTTVPRTAWGQPDLQGYLGLPHHHTPATARGPGRTRVLDPRRKRPPANKKPSTATLACGTGKPGERKPARTSAPTTISGWTGEPGLSGTRRTSLIVDPPNGRMPPGTAEAATRAEARGESRRAHPADSWLDRSAFDRCILGFKRRPPITPGGYNQNMQLFQTPDHVVLVTEMVHTARVVPLDGRAPLSDGIRQWSGNSRGHWEGDTLVVETSNVNDKRRWRGSTKNMKLVERFTRVDADTLEYEFTVTDPETWTSSWTASIPMQRTDRSDVRVRVPRRELRHAQHPGRATRRREGPDREAVITAERRQLHRLNHQVRAHVR